MSCDDTIEVGKFCDSLRKFVRERDWEQFHTPKNLAMAIGGEVGELIEIFQWLTPEQSQRALDDPATAGKVREEMADILIYLIRMADVLGIDLNEIIWRKLEKNGAKYPVHLSKGSAKKYTEF